MRIRGDGWKRIGFSDTDLGCLTYYYSSRKSDVPTRAVDKVWDNKKDPNFETKTYGVFTDCNCRGRRSCVRDGRRYLFFMTSFQGVRQITGYYVLSTYADVTCSCSGNTVALRASNLHFVDTGIPFESSTYGRISARDIRGGKIRTLGPPRGFCGLDTQTVGKLLGILDKRPDITREYVREVRRLENENLKETGLYKYPSSHRKESFTRKDINDYLF